MRRCPPVGSGGIGRPQVVRPIAPRWRGGKAAVIRNTRDAVGACTSACTERERSAGAQPRVERAKLLLTSAYLGQPLRPSWSIRQDSHTRRTIALPVTLTTITARSALQQSQVGGASCSTSTPLLTITLTLAPRDDVYSP